MASQVSDDLNSAGQLTRVTIRPIDCSGSCHEPAVGCTCSGEWREVDAVVAADGNVIAAPPLPSGMAMQAAANTLAGVTKSLSPAPETA